MKNDSRYIKSKISGIRQISEFGYLLQIQYNFAWQPGEVTGLKLVENEPPRLYSIAGSENNNEITILFTEKPSGMLTPRLSEVMAGDAIYVSQPFGKFRPSSNNAWWICNGTGIAPFRGVWQKEKPEKITLIHGVRKQKEKYFQHEISAKNINYHACLSVEDHEQDFHGRVTEYLHKRDDLPIDANYYLCGSAEMSVEVRDILIKKGVPFMNIYTEIYF